MNKTQAIKYLKDRNLDIQKGRASFLLCDLVYGAYVDLYKDYKKDFGPWFFKYVSEGSKDSSFGFSQICAKNTIIALSECLLQDFLQKPESLSLLLKKHDRLNEEAKKIWEEYQGLKSKDKKTLIGYYRKYYSATRQWWMYACLGEEKGEIINRRIVPIFAKKYHWELEEAREVLTILSHPEREMVFTKARKELLKLCLEFEKNEFSKDKIAGEIEKYLQKYFWMKTDFYEAREYTSEMLMEEMNDEVSKGEEMIRREIEKIEETFKGIKDKEEAVRKRCHFDSEDEKLINFSKQVSLWMDDRKIWMMGQTYYFFKFLKEITKNFGVSYSEASFYTSKELLDFLDGEKISAQEIEKRKEKVFAVREAGLPLKLFYEKDADDLIKAMEREDGEKIKGLIASRGGEKIISGIARIIRNPSKESFNQGEILVTSMTRVEFVPLMRKAKAIITDEGGMACHAAIVSRELGIPAIIGTKHAMRTLKDGDEIEMNMANGEIRKAKTR